MAFFTVNIFNRRKLMIDSDAEYIARCADMLKRAGIPHEVHTKRLRSTVGMRADVGSYMNLNQAYVGNPQHYGYTYTICVPRKHLEAAKRVVSI